MNYKPVLCMVFSACTISLQCGDRTENEGQSTDSAEAALLQGPPATDTSAVHALDEMVQFKFDLLLSNLPSPLEILNDLNKSNIAYQPELPADKTKFSAASSSAQKALFMGIYSIDIGYQINFDHSQDAIYYIASIKKLSDDLGISRYYDKNFYDRFNANLGNKDSLINITNMAISLTDKYCRTNNNIKTSAYIFTGSWIESIYIAIQSIRENTGSESNKPVLQRIWNQRLHLKQLLEAVEAYKNEPYFKDIIPQLEQIQSVCQDAEDESELLKGGLEEIRTKILTLRTNISG